MIISLNKFFRIFAENEGLRLKVFRTQRRTSLDSVLSMREYRMLLDKAVEIGNRRLYCIMRTLASSGIRIGELAYITVESLCSGICPVVSKGRARDIFIPHEVCRLLLDYCAAAGIKSGLVFCSQGNPGKMMDKSQIWRESVFGFIKNGRNEMYTPADSLKKVIHGFVRLIPTFAGIREQPSLSAFASGFPNVVPYSTTLSSICSAV